MRLIYIFILFTVLQIIPSQARALELSAGLRESFVTKNDHPYGGGSTARLRRKLLDANFDTLTLNTKLSLLPSRSSHIYRPTWSSNINGLDTMLDLIRLGGSEAIIKPQLVKGSPLNISPFEIENQNIDARTIFYTYQRELNIYLTLSRKNAYKTLIIGSGINSLYTKENTKRIISLHNYVRKSLNARTDLALNLNDIKLLSNLQQNPELIANIKENFSEVAYSINQLSIQSLRSENSETLALEIETLYKNHINTFGDLDFSISSIQLPNCKETDYSEVDMKCIIPLAPEASQKQLAHLAKTIKSLSNKDIRIKNIEILASTTDYEPDLVDPRMIYYKRFFKDLDIKKLFEIELPKLRIDPPFKKQEIKKPSVCIYYDAKDTPEKKDNLGRIHSTMLESLLGGFPKFKVERSELKKYEKKEIFQCEKAFYIASHFSAEIPEVFLKDLKTYISSHDFMWFNYKFSNFQSIDKRIAFTTPYVLTSDKVPTPENPNIGFFQFFEYKGEEFFKKVGWSPLSDNFISSTEINFIQVSDTKKINILSQARHNKTKQRIPYVVSQKISSGNLWYIADLPFSFVHYEDRYLILTDILWDFLGETPKSNELKALIRFEDIAPNVNLADFRWAMNYLSDEKIPFSIALIPYFADMIGSTSLSNYQPTFKPITKYPNFIATLKYAKNLDADFVWHGVAHQVDDFISGYNGLSGSDYEFWLFPENTPIPYDSVDWVMNRLEMGEKVLDDLDILPMAWEIPHYAASALDYHIFGKVFEWTYHRPVNFTHEVLGSSDLRDEHLMFSCKDTSCREERKALLRNLNIEADYSNFGASLYPYPIYKDAYGQKIIPETLGMVDFAFYSNNTWRPVNKPQDILRRAKKLRVIRGAYASFFWHTSLLNKEARYYQEQSGSFETIGGKNTLINIVEGLRKLGYKFVSIADCDNFKQKGCK